MELVEAGVLLVGVGEGGEAGVGVEAAEEGDGERGCRGRRSFARVPSPVSGEDLGASSPRMPLGTMTAGWPVRDWWR